MAHKSFKTTTHLAKHWGGRVGKPAANKLDVVPYPDENGNRQQRRAYRSSVNSKKNK